MIVGIKIECFVCADQILGFLEKHEKEINEILKKSTNKKDRIGNTYYFKENHQILQIGYSEQDFPLNNRNELYEKKRVGKT